MFVADESLKSMYIFAAEHHNNNMINNPFPDAGFDLITPELINVLGMTTQKINFKVKCSATLVENNIAYPSGYYMYPRSSTGSKTPLRLANSIGIIDSGYRGNLMSVFDNIRTDNFIIQPLDKVIQICGPGLVPIFIYIVDNESELSDPTVRGTGGFGSTTVTELNNIL
jgi:dUTP pyrophosphatase